MPTFNAAGHLIEEEKDAVVLRRTERLSKLKWPEDWEPLWHLTGNDFKAWLYTLHPTKAMLLTGDKSFAYFQFQKRQKGIIDNIGSWIWRMIWG